ncbi:hypothetical protein [Streptomyces sp. NPDC051162]|uniref:hypothetical protein n=1 Tax=Streptomyces sp. NPDC051162 TaxID=3154747 RepID=UPI003412D2FD
MDPAEYSEIKSWAEGFSGEVDYVDFLTKSSTLGEWLAMSHVLWPRFVVHRGCVLWERAYDPDGFDAWYRHFDGDARSIEPMINRLVLGDVIDCGGSPEDHAALKDIADTVGNAWCAALSTAYPDRTFDVIVDDTDDGPVVSFAAAPLE